MTDLQEIYIAFFGRPADPDGLQYWNGQLEAGSTLVSLASRIALQDEFQTAFEGLSNADVIETIFQNLFGRSPDAEGLHFYLDALDAGHASRGDLAIRIIDAARDADFAVLKAKVAAADLFTGHLDSAAEMSAYHGEGAAGFGRLFLKGITSDTDATAETVLSAIAKLQAGGGAQFPSHDGGQAVNGVTYALNAVITPYQMVDGKESLLIGTGSADGFAIATNHGTQIELGISLRNSDGTVLESSGYAGGHVAAFDGADPAKTVLALSIASLGQAELSEFFFRLSIDTDPSAGVSLKHYLLQGSADLGYSWALDANNDGIANGAGDTVQEIIAISEEQGHFMLLDMFALNDRSGLIDVHLAASQGGLLLADAAVRIDFDGTPSIVGTTAPASICHG